MALLRRLLRPRAKREHDAGAVVDPLVDRIIAATDPRLAHLKESRRRLRAPVAEARTRFAEMVDRIPGPMEVGAAAWSSEPLLRPLFAQAADAAKVFNDDPDARAFLEAHPASDAFGMLGLKQEERRVLATVQQGSGMLQAEVARTTVSFGEPRILALATNADEVRPELVARCLEFLALRALEHVGSAKLQRRELEKERSLLQAELRLAQRRGAGLGGLGADSNARGMDVVERDLARVVGELSEAATTQLLPMLVDAIVESLAHSEKHLAIEPCTLALDSMNFVVPPSAQSVTPCAATLRLGERGTFAVLIGRFPRAEFRPAEDRLAEAARYL